MHGGNRGLERVRTKAARIQRSLDQRRGKTSIPLNEAMDLVWSNLRLAGRRDITRLAKQIGRTEDKLEQVLQEVEELRDELGDGSQNGTSRSRSGGNSSRASSGSRSGSGSGSGSGTRRRTTRRSSSS